MTRLPKTSPWTVAVVATLVAALVRKMRAAITRWGVTDVELRTVWPGDGLVGQPKFTWTNALTIDRPAREVWPWLVQLGQGRGGPYSYDWLEKLVGRGVHSTDRVISELQVPLKVPDRVIRMARYAPFNPIAFIDAGHALVLGGVRDSDEELLAGRASSTWAFIAEPVDDQTCRLVVRSRGRSVMARLQAPLQFLNAAQDDARDQAKGRGLGSRERLRLSWFHAQALVCAGSSRHGHVRRATS